MQMLYVDFIYSFHSFKSMISWLFYTRGRTGKIQAAPTAVMQRYEKEENNKGNFDNFPCSKYGTAVGDDAYGPDSLQTVFSSGKNFEALAVAHLVDRGLLDYGDTVTR